MQEVIESYAKGMLKEHLSYEISEPEAEAYYAFCRQANSDLIRHSLKELKGFIKSAKRLKAEGKAAPPFLPKLTRIYFRKVEEQTRLFTALSIFESAYRVHLANWMEHHYGIREWGNPIYGALTAGKACTQVTHINGVGLTPAVANAIDKLLKGIDGYDLMGATVAKQTEGAQPPVAQANCQTLRNSSRSSGSPSKRLWVVRIQRLRRSPVSYRPSSASEILGTHAFITARSQTDLDY